MNQTRSRVLTGLGVLLGVVMIGGGAAKLAGQSSQVTAFAAWGLPSWFRALVGTFEIVGGIFLLMPRTRPFGSFILATIMVGALWAHAAHAEWRSLIPVAVLLMLFLALLRGSRDRAIQLLGSL